MLEASFKRNDKKAYWVIGIFSVVVFVVISLLGKFKLEVSPGFDIHLFAKINAVLNTMVAVLLVAALFAVKVKNFELHKKIMLIAMVLSVLFLVSYIAHHLFAGEALFGDVDHDGMVSAQEKLDVGGVRTAYLILLITHIILAGLILPVILLTAYRALTAQYASHKKLAKYTWPLWLYVAITGPVIYLMISPYYQ
jgi:putative membrane protein